MPLRALILLLILAVPAATQSRREEREDEPAKLPNGKSQQEEILKADHVKSLEDADALMRLSAEIKADLEKNDRHILSLATLKKLDEVEKIAKRMRTRMKKS